MTTTETAYNEAETIRDRLSHRASEIKKNDDLTPDAKRRQIAEAHSDAVSRMAALRERRKAAHTESQLSATRSLFGGGYSSGADAISLRDATERAAQLEDTADARALLRRANANGDRTLARAIVLEAIERSKGQLFGNVWINVINEQAEADPSISDIVKQVAQPSEIGSLEDSMRFSMPTMSDLTYDL